jgi:signal transduction histidine kinase
LGQRKPGLRVAVRDVTSLGSPALAVRTGSDVRRHAPVAAVVAVGLGALAVAATAITVWAVHRSPVLVEARTVSFIRGCIVASYTAVGIYTWLRRPGSRLGPLFIAAGFGYALASLEASSHALPYTVGRGLTELFSVYLVYLAVIFPNDRLSSPGERRLMVTFSAASAISWGLVLALADKLPSGSEFADCGAQCPRNALTIIGNSSGATHWTVMLANGVFVVGLLWAIALVAGKLRSPSRIRRRAVTPVLVAFVALAVATLVFALAHALNATGVKDVARIAAAICELAVPIALLTGQIRGRAFALARLVRMLSGADEKSVTPANVEELMRDALADRTVALALARPDGAGYIDVNGADLELPTDSGERAVVPIIRAGRPIAAVIHDPAAVDDAAVAQSLAAGSLLLLENTRLVEELRASRARLAHVAGQERMRLERDLHDGAQQRLTALQIRLGALLERVHEPDLVLDLERAALDAAGAVDQLRTLAHGIYPRELELLGLPGALRVAARNAAIPVSVQDGGIGRCPPDIEAAVYFCCLEALTNAAKHAGEDARVTITLEQRPGELGFSVVDDGVGFELDHESAGIGLLNMRDRIEAMGGELVIVSEPRFGTTVRGSIPLLS